MRKLFVLILLVLATAVMAKKPGRVTYQGLLTTSAGGAVPNGNHSLELKIFSAPTGGSPLWSESQTVTTTDGIFSVIMGSAIPIPDSAMFDTAAYLEITVESDPPLSPRTRLEDVPFSFLSSSVQGEGPIQLNALNPASGEEGNLHMDIDPDASGRVKVQFHWDANDPGSGAISSIAWDFSADSSTKETSHYDPTHRLNRSRKSRTFLDATEIMSVGSATDTASYSQQISADSGFSENIVTRSGTAQATGKRQHKPVTITKEWGAASGGTSVELSSFIHVDSGFGESRLYTTPTATVEAHENGHALGIGHLDYLKKVSDPTTGEIYQQLLWLDADSGVVETTTAEHASGMATGKRQHKPFTITKELDVVKVGSSATLHEYLDADSGYTDSINIIDGGYSVELIAKARGFAKGIKNKAKGLSSDSATFESFLSADSGYSESLNVTAAADFVETIMKVRPLEKRVSSQAENSAGDNSIFESVLSVDTGYNESATMNKADLIATISHGVSQTREHVLLSRQVGVPGAADEMTLELLNTNSGPSTTMSRYDGTETAAIEMSVSDTAEWLALTTETAAAKYSNIVLKRGIAGSLVSVSHVGAGTNDGVFISSNAAAGGTIGINTSTPILPFQLVGSGCYTGSFGACSDARYKKEITPLHKPLATISQMQGVNYSWKRDEYPEQKFPEGNQIGLIAQDVEKILPEIVLTDRNGYKSIDYAKLTPLLLEAVKEQQQQIASQQMQIDRLESLFKELAEKIGKTGYTYGSK